MNRKAHYKPSNGDINGKGKYVAMLASSSQSETLSGFYSLPETLRHIVANYISYDQRDPTKLALLGEQHITLGFSQHPKLKLGSCWHFGCLSLEDRLETSIEVNLDTPNLFKDYKRCLDFLVRENALFFPAAVGVLVFQLDISSQFYSSSLDNLEYTLTMLEKHLNKVQHVVFALEKYAFCYFSLKDVIDNATKLRQAVDRPQALKHIINDLRTCWATNQKLSIMLLLDYYILSDNKPKSDRYLTKFVISLSHCRNQELFDAVDPTLNSSKLNWLYNFETLDDMKNIDQRITRRCHAFHFDKTPALQRCNMDQFFLLLKRTCCFEDNPFIEKIVINSKSYGYTMKLPRPSTPLTDTSLRSALVELTLTGMTNTLELTQLSTGYFPHLAHLTVIGGRISGQLDSHRVPRLKTLILEPNELFDGTSLQLLPLIRERIQPFIHAGRPWQLVVSQESGGWSLASYDEPILSPQDEVKEGSNHSPLHLPPLIRELMLVAFYKQNTWEWQSQLNGEPQLEAAAGNHSDQRLAWSPERVEKITAFASPSSEFQLVFENAIPGQERILTSLACYNMKVEIDGAALPRLQSLELNCSQVKLLGPFSDLRTLSCQMNVLQFPWEMDAPLLESLSCQNLVNGNKLSLRPQLLPRLFFLQIELFGDFPSESPRILFDDNSLGLLQVEHVVLEQGIATLPFFNQCQVHNVSNLELVVDAYDLPACWHKTEWLCETLTISVCKGPIKNAPQGENPDVVVLPLLPRVKKLTVKEKDCHVLLNRAMPNLTNCTVPSPRLLGPDLKCPALTHLCFTEKLVESDKKKCLDRATYEAIGAPLRWVYFDFDSEAKSML